MIINNFNLCFVLLLMFFTTSCNSQESKPLNNKKMEGKEIQIISKVLENNNYKLDENQFNKKNLELLGISSVNNSDKDYEEIIIQKEETDYQISKKGKFIKIGQDVLPDLDVLEKTLFVDKKALPYFNDIVNLNKLLYKDDPSTIPYLMHQNSDLGIDAVILFDYEKNQILYNSVLNKVKSIEDSPNYFKFSLIFYNNKEEVRRKLLKDLMTKSPTLIDELIIYMYTHYDSFIKKGFMANKINNGLAYLLEISLDKSDNVSDLDDNKAYSFLNNCYIQNEKILDNFQKENYYGYPYLKKYSEIFNLNKNDDQPLIYIINDPDGYTNLRSNKNASSEILQKVKSGEGVEVLNNSGDWWQVKTKSGEVGFIHKSRIRSSENSVSVLKIYDRADFNSFSQEITTKNEIEYIYKVSDWDFIKIDGRVGYLPPQEQIANTATLKSTKYSFLADDEPLPEKKKGFWDRLFS